MFDGQEQIENVREAVPERRQLSVVVLPDPLRRVHQVALGRHAEPGRHAPHIRARGAATPMARRRKNGTCFCLLLFSVFSGFFFFIRQC